jgi:antitoxin MazE
VVEIADKAISVTKLERRHQALANMRARQWTAPTDYRFDRDEANAR